MKKYADIVGLVYTKIKSYLGLAFIICGYY